MEIEGNQNCLVTNILQNIYFCVAKKVIQVWNNMRMSKWWQNVIFWWNIPLNQPKKQTAKDHKMTFLDMLKTR